MPVPKVVPILYSHYIGILHRGCMLVPSQSASTKSGSSRWLLSHPRKPLERCLNRTPKLIKFCEEQFDICPSPNSKTANGPMEGGQIPTIILTYWLPFLWGWLHLLIHCDLFGLWVPLVNLEIVADLPVILYIVQNEVK
jgi:hypothetical protein